MKRVERGGLRLLVFPGLEEAGLTCAVSTLPTNVREETDRRRFVAAVGLDPERVRSVRQVHRSDVLLADGIERRPQGDGLVTDAPGRPLLLSAADCSLVVVADPEHRAVGVAHAGWKGSARGVVVNLVQAMKERYGTNAPACLAGIGPTIGQSSYPVGGDVPAAFLRTRSWATEYVAARGDRLHFDLAGVNARFLVECGIPRASIEVSDLDTFACADLLHSFRREGTGAGHHGLVAAWT